MPTQLLSAKLIEHLKSPVAGQVEVFDRTLPGFGIRLSKGGKKAWVLLYRVHGRKRRMTLGSYPALSLSDARMAAGKAIQAVQRGEDPALEKQQKKRTQPTTFGELAKDYLERYAKARKRSWKNDELNLRLHILPEWNNRKVESIKRADVIAIVDRAEANNQPHLARQLLAVVRKLFNWAVEKSLAEVNPATGVRLGTRPLDRSRTLSVNELQQLWAAWEKLGNPLGSYFKVVLLTVQRRSEIARMRWEHIDDEGLWTIPPEENKSNRLHVVPLSSEVRAILRGLPRTTSPYVFPGRIRVREGHGECPKPAPAISGFSAAVEKVNAKLENRFEWRIHDLRRTGTTEMARLKFPPHVLSAVLNHAPQTTMKGVLSVYNRHQYLEEKKEALEAWGTFIRTKVAEPLKTNEAASAPTAA